MVRRALQHAKTHQKQGPLKNHPRAPKNAGRSFQKTHPRTPQKSTIRPPSKNAKRSFQKTHPRAPGIAKRSFQKTHPRTPQKTPSAHTQEHKTLVSENTSAQPKSQNARFRKHIRAPKNANGE
jgi:hypothetical protein